MKISSVKEKLENMGMFDQSYEIPKICSKYPGGDSTNRERP